MRETYWWEKLGASLVNILIVGIFTFLLTKLNFEISWKIMAVLIFFFYSLAFLATPLKRDIGMIVIGSYWKKDYPSRSHLIFIILYTLSFTTIFIRVFFPFDLLFLNLAFQLLVIKLTGTTLHGYLAGNLVTIRNIK